MTTLRTFSYGGGVQSTAALVLAAQRRIDFPVFLMANVGDDSEDPLTLEYVEEHAKPYAARHGIELHIIDRIKRDGSVETIYGRITKPVFAGVLREISDRDTDYAVRYGLVLDALARAHQLGYPAGIGWDTNPDPELDGYRVVVYIELPTGQVSWHMPEHPQPWDGHTTDEKHERIRAYGAGADVTA